MTSLFAKSKPKKSGSKRPRSSSRAQARHEGLSPPAPAISAGAEEEEEVKVEEAETFEDLKLSPALLGACAAMGFRRPFPVQSSCIPAVLTGKDVLGCAETGSGKTAAFALPMLQKLGEDPYGIFGVVLTPTRELAIQLSEQFDALGSRMGLRQCVVIGGMDMMKQSLALGRRPHIIIATPGRLRDHLQGPSPPNLSKAKFLVLDEADRLLSPTFEGELRVILNALPSKRQSLLFSATMTGNLRRLERLGLMNPVTYDLTREATIPATLSQEYLFVPNQMKVCFLAQTLRQTLHRKVLGTGDEVKNADEEEEEDHRLARSVIVFAGSCKKCQEVTETLLELKVECVSLHSMMTQRRRLAALGKFKSSQCHVLVSTDVSSRGLDIPDVDLVINFDIPRVATDYVHRVGRTARAGRRGRAISLVSQFDVELVHSIEAYTRSKLDLCEDVLEKDVVKLISSVNKASRIAKMRMLEHGFDEQLEKRSKRSKKKRSSSAD